MAILTVGPTSSFPTIAAAMLVAAPTDTIVLELGYGNENATVTQNGITVSGDASSTGIVLQLAPGVTTFTLAGTAPINVVDASDGNGIVGNDGDNVVTVSGGVDAVVGGLGTDRLVVDYRLATGAITGDSTSNVTESGGGGRSVTITSGTFEHFTILTGAGADTITTGAGDDIINTGEGVGTVTAGQGANTITGGSGADTITALDGGNVIDGGDGANTITSGNGNDVISGGTGPDTIVAAGGDDVITVRGGADSVAAGTGTDRLVVDYSAFNTAVTGLITSGTLLAGYNGVITDLAGNSVDFLNVENFTITGGSGNDTIATGDGIDVLSGGAGNDILTGGLGDDLVIFAPGFDNDIVTDFVAGTGTPDRIDLTGFPTITTLADVLARTTQVGPDAVIDFDNGDVLTLQNVDVATLSADDFTLAVNDAPTQNVNAGLTLSEGASATIAATLLDFDDPDNTDAQIGYTLDTTAANGTLWLDADDSGTLQAGEELTAGEGFTQADIGAGRLRYTHNGSEAGDSFQFDVSDGAGGSVSDQTFAIAITPVNDAPVLGNVPAQSSYGRLAPPVVLAPAASVADADSTTLASAAVRIAGGNFAGDGDVLAADTTGTGITATYDAGTETLTLSGADTLAHYQQVLQSITYQSTSGNPSNSGANPTRTIEWQINDGLATTNATTTLNLLASSNPDGDFGGDGNSDILWRNDNGQAGLWQMDGNQILSADSLGFVGNDWHIAESADFGGDGNSDILWRNDNGQAGVWQMDGEQMLSVDNLGFVGNDWHIADAADLSGDGNSDILWRNDNGQVGLWQMDGGQMLSSDSLGFVGNDWHIVDAADFNGDSHADILWRNDNGQVGLWTMDGAQVLSTQTIGVVGNDWHIAGANDFGGDGREDILWRNDNGQVGLWQMDGAQVLSSQSLGIVGRDWHIAETGDYRGDGDANILWRNDNGQVGLWQMDGTQMLSADSLGLVGNDWQIAAHQFDYI